MSGNKTENKNFIIKLIQHSGVSVLETSLLQIVPIFEKYELYDLY